MLAQYVTFSQKLRESASAEVRLISRLVWSDQRTVTGRNIGLLWEELKIDPLQNTAKDLKRMYMMMETSLDPEEAWKLEMLDTMLEERLARGVVLGAGDGEEEEEDLLSFFIDTLATI